MYNFWKRGTAAVFDVRITDTDAESYLKTAPWKLLQEHKREKKKKYLDLCHEAHRHFTPLVYSIDGMEGKEAIAARKQLGAKLAAKWGRHYSQVCSMVKSRIGFALARAASRCLRGTRDARLKFNQPLDWISHSGVRVYAY